MVKNNIFELDKNDLDRSKELHKKSIFVNMLDATFLRHWNQKYYDKLIKAGVTLDEIDIEAYNFRQAVDVFNARISTLSNIGMDKVIIARRTEDVYRAKNEGKIAFFFHTQHGSIIENDVRLLETLHQMGLRVFGLCYSIRNHIADGCNEITDAGLSAFGQRVVKKCNELGIVIDLSHVGHQSSLDAIELSKDPTIFSHSNANGVYRNRRNIDDDQIMAIGEKNGVIGVASWGPMVKQLTSNEDQPTLVDMLDHLDYIVDMVGIDHVGIGVDVGWKRTKEETEIDSNSLAFSAAELIPRSGPYIYGHHNWYVKELWDLENWPLITDGLVARGYLDDEILKILGGNFMRVYKAVWDK